ncbi:Zinc finger protein 862 [Nymphon striatum]|nr:Zinc finger protein 862 [Nymphon striatum]
MGRKRKSENVPKNDAKVRKISEFMCVSLSIKQSNSVTNGIVVDTELRNELTETEKQSETLSERGETPKCTSNRKFRDDWKHNRPWLTYNPQTRNMYCSVCQSADVTNSFTTGCDILKKENVTKHEKRKGENGHLAALKIVQASKDYKKSAEVQLSKSKSAVTAAMKNIFFMASNNLPNMLISELNEHCIDQGCSSLKSLKVDKHTSYKHSTSVQEFQQCMVEVINDRFKSDLGDSKFSIMVDESTDISVDQNMIIYVRYLEQSLGSYKPTSVLLDVCKLRDGATADQLKSSILCSLDTHHLNLDNLVGISTDGAAVMTGRKSGLVQRLKAENPTILATHCISHRLALASGQAADSVPYLLKYQEIINSIYKYFENSPKNMSRLEKIQSILNSTGVSARFKLVFHTRWLSFEGSVRAVCENYSPLVSVLSEDKGARAQGLLKCISHFKFLYVSHFLADVLKHLSILCKRFQSSTIDFTSISTSLEYTAGEVMRLTESKQGKMLKCFETSVPDAVSETGSFEFHGHVIKDSEKQREKAERCCTQFGEKLLENLRERFADVGDSKVLKAFCGLFDPAVFVREGEALDECIKTVSEHVCEEEFREEYECFRNDVMNNFSKVANDINSVCQIALRKRDMYGCVADVAYKLLCVPVSSVECERGFSVQNLVKTKLRNRYDEAAESLRKEIELLLSVDNERAAGRQIVALVLVHLSRDDIVAANKAYQDGSGHLEGEELDTLSTLIEGYDERDSEQCIRALSSPFIKHMDVEYARLAKSLPIPSSEEFSTTKETSDTTEHEAPKTAVLGNDLDDEYAGGLC